MSFPELSDQDRNWYILKGYVITESQYGHWREWYLNGKPHREDGFPAVEYASGYREWYLNGERHREDGPAIERTNGDREWWINDERMSEEDHRKAVREIKLQNVC